MVDRLTKERKTEIFEAALELIAELGYEKVTMEQLAKRSRASTATLYRRWGSKSKLVSDALEHLNPALPDGVLADTGSFASDIRHAVDAMADQSIERTRFVTALQFASTRDAELAAAFRRSLGAQLQPLLDALVDRAVTRGEIAADCPALPYLHILFTAPAVLLPILESMDWEERGGMHAYIDAVILPAVGLKSPTTNKEN